MRAIVVDVDHPAALNITGELTTVVAAIISIAISFPIVTIATAMAILSIQDALDAIAVTGTLNAADLRYVRTAITARLVFNAVATLIDSGAAAVIVGVIAMAVIISTVVSILVVALLACGQNCREASQYDGTGDNFTSANSVAITIATFRFCWGSRAYQSSSSCA